MAVKPLVSIITPSFNGGQYLEECIKSILDQNYPNIEHIIQDGNSTDQTKKILKKYQNPKYKNRIKIFVAPDKGQTDALNKAIQKTKGDVLLVLNADDMLMPYAVSWGVENLKKYPEVGVIYGDVYIINSKGEICDIYKSHEYSFEELLSVELVPPAQAAFVRRSALEKVGYYTDSALDTCPDYEMWIRIAQKFPMKHVWGVVTKYRHHDTPQLDSKNPRTVQRFLVAKKEVMDRVFNDPKTHAKIKKLRRRAYGSLYTWSATTANELKEYELAFKYKIKAFWFSPTINNFKRIVFTWKDSPLYYTRKLLGL